MRTNTQALFAAIIKAGRTECLCDIGSRDGAQALFFRRVLPNARIMAFEANPVNYRKMKDDPELAAHRIAVMPFAIAAERGKARFNVIDVDYDNPAENTGLSSLLAHKELAVKEMIEVETRRIDDLVRERFPMVEKVALWIDVEGAEYGVIKGIERIRDKVTALHLEVAKRPMRVGQKTLDEVSALLNSSGFQACGSNMGPGDEWGDVVFIKASLASDLGWRFGLCQWKGYLTQWMRGGEIAVFLKKHCPQLYRGLRKLYLWLGT